jgi:hypothetical protein
MQLWMEIINQIYLHGTQGMYSTLSRSKLKDVHHIVGKIPFKQLFCTLEAILPLYPLDKSKLELQGTNMEMLLTFLFWVEKLLEVQMMRHELITAMKGRVEEPIYLSGDNILSKLLMSFKWIEDLGITVSTTYSIYRHNVIDKQINTKDALTWLLSQSIFPMPAACASQEQERAATTLIHLASEWKAAYSKMVNEIVEKNQTSKISFPSVFQLFCK